MLHQPTIEKLLAMRMEPMVETWRSFEQDENAQQLSFEEKLSLMVDRLWTWRQNLALERRLRYAKLRGNACVEDIDYRASRGLDRTLMRSLANDSGWVARHENVFIIGQASNDRTNSGCPEPGTTRSSAGGSFAATFSFFRITRHKRDYSTG